MDPACIRALSVSDGSEDPALVPHQSRSKGLLLPHGAAARCVREGSWKQAPRWRLGLG